MWDRIMSGWRIGKAVAEVAAAELSSAVAEAIFGWLSGGKRND